MLVLKSQRDVLYCLFQFAESDCLRLSFKAQNIKTEFHRSNQIHLYPWLDHKLPLISLVRSQATTFCLSPNRTFAYEHLQLRLI